MAFAALVMTLLVGVLIGVWVLALSVSDGLLSTSALWPQIRSAIFPMGTMLIFVWGFANLNTTFYGLIRERFAERLGLSGDILKKVEACQTSARDKANRALSTVKRMKR